MIRIMFILKLTISSALDLVIDFNSKNVMGGVFNNDCNYGNN